MDYRALLVLRAGREEGGSHQGDFHKQERLTKPGRGMSSIQGARAVWRQPPQQGSFAARDDGESESE